MVCSEHGLDVQVSFASIVGLFCLYSVTYRGYGLQ